MKKQIYKVILIVCLLLCVLYLFLRTGHNRKKEAETGMFSWDEETVEDPAGMKELIKALGITRWYQEFPQDLDEEKTAAFINYMNTLGVKTDALVGSVEWGFEEDGASLIACISSIDSYNRNVRLKERIGGLMVDVEPYITEKFKNDREYYMDIYVNGMKKAYTYAKSKNIDIIACIPRHYDDQGLREGLEELIAETCDEVAVMNYGRGNETEMIAEEVRLAEKYKKVFHCILEFQNVGVHGLTEEETYREEGIGEAIKTWGKIRDAYPDARITADYHWTRPLLEMIKEE